MNLFQFFKFESFILALGYYVQAHVLNTLTVMFSFTITHHITTRNNGLSIYFTLELKCSNNFPNSFLSEFYKFFFYLNVGKS